MKTAAQIITAYDRNAISRTKAFNALKALGYDTFEVRAMLGDLDCIGGA